MSAECRHTLRRARQRGTSLNNAQLRDGHHATRTERPAVGVRDPPWEGQIDRLGQVPLDESMTRRPWLRKANLAPLRVSTAESSAAA
jgi:hypothetical protein